MTPLRFNFWSLWSVLCVCLMCAWGSRASAHDVPRTHVEVRAGKTGADVTITASVVGFTLEYPTVELGGEAMETVVRANRGAMADAVAGRFGLVVGGVTLTAPLPGVERSEYIPDLEAVRLRLRYEWQLPPAQVTVRAGSLFPVDENHTVFVSVYDRDSGSLIRQTVLSRTDSSLTYETGGRQSVFAVVQQFIREGVYHIFIGPDHILFIVGLLLMGGGIKQLLKVVTAFTVAHSITLVLATLNILNPSPRLIEPVIALSIVFVGIHSLMQGRIRSHVAGDTETNATDPTRTPRDGRLYLAFGFGLIHGFGFASVLRELDLPRTALGWSLASFNVGVELGQACIVLAVAPLLALLWRRSERAGALVTTMGAWLVVLAGAYWFGQRLTS